MSKLKNQTNYFLKYLKSIVKYRKLDKGIKISRSARTNSRTVLEGNSVIRSRTVIHNSSIGSGTIVGARSLVTKDIEPYSINVGIPAKKIGYRFEKKHIDFLLEFKWWEKDFTWLKENSYIFEDIHLFYEKNIRMGDDNR